MIDKQLSPRRVLLVEDNEKILRGNKRMLEWEGYQVDCAMTLAEARESFDKSRPDSIVLDVMLPDGNGLDFMRELRASVNGSVPILLLTGLSSDGDILRGLKAGGDDYLTKPYDFPILLARIEALIRRAERVPESISKGRLTLELAASVALVDGVDMLLTQKEFALLLIFTENAERYIGADYLYEKVWKQPLSGDANALRSAIKRLRTKLAGSGWQIAWSRGEGYCLERE